MKINSNSGISSFAKVRTHKSRIFPETKSISCNKKAKTSDSINRIVSFLNKKGINAEGITKTSKAFSNILTNISGKPVEISLSIKRLSLARLNYSRSITAAGGIFLAITTVQEFEEWYRSTFDTSRK